MKIIVCKCWGGKILFLTPAHYSICDYTLDWHPRLDPEVGSSLKYKYSVTQSRPGDYIYVKWWDGGPGFCEPFCESLSLVEKHGFLAPISPGPCAFSCSSSWDKTFRPSPIVLSLLSNRDIWPQKDRLYQPSSI